MPLGAGDWFWLRVGQTLRGAVVAALGVRRPARILLVQAGAGNDKFISPDAYTWAHGRWHAACSVVSTNRARIRRRSRAQLKESTVTLPWPPERTFMQEQRPWDARYDVRTDAVAVYGLDESLAGRSAAWKERGYAIFVMTGLAWGSYQDYLLGRWDGRDHWDEAQYQLDPARHVPVPKQHGKDMPYMVPTESYAAYLEENLRRALATGCSAVILEEPEFWFSTGYGPAFQRAWQDAYGQPWRDPAADPLAWIMAARLKQRLYHDLIARLCRAVKAASVEAGGPPVRCYVATHSPLNYTAWGIVSPELSLRTTPRWMASSYRRGASPRAARSATRDACASASSRWPSWSMAPAWSWPAERTGTCGSSSIPWRIGPTRAGTSAAAAIR
jgi:hypothetical protein